MAFTSAVDGVITGARFYQVAGDTGAHTGSLWDAAGQRLAQVEFQATTGSGWQRAVFDEPVPVTAGRTYTVSYFTADGKYAYRSSGFADPVTSGPLTALSPENGRYRYGSGGVVPTGVWESTNYFVDVEFRPDADRPTVTSTAPGADATAVSLDATVSATFDRDPSGLNAGLSISGLAGTVAGSTAVNAAARTLTFTPAAALAGATIYTATLTLGGSALHTWTFTTAEPAVEGQRQTLFGSVVPAVASAADSDAVEVGTAFTVARTGQVTALRFYRGAGHSGKTGREHVHTPAT